MVKKNQTQERNTDNEVTENLASTFLKDKSATNKDTEALQEANSASLPIERHPFEPFLPQNAKVLFLGSFPPQEKRWSMKFYYPNYTNDFWYIIGLLWFDDKRYFTIPEEKRFNLEKITDFCRTTGFAMYDTATEIRRLMDNASDKFLEVVTPTDIPLLLSRLPHCEVIVTTGQKSTETLVETFGCEKPAMGEYVEVSLPVKDENGNAKTSRTYKLYRLPSTSRAYPLKLEKKAAAYKQMFEMIGYLK